ncbi:MAG TPA: multicopper oxidase domain-containing protein [Nitrososphaeraceae archaeon]
MNKLFYAAILGVVLIAGIAGSPLALGQLKVAQAQETPTKNVLLVASEKEVQIAPDNALHPGGVKYNAYVFNGSIPGPVIAIDQGDVLNITLKNEGKVIHSLDFHAGYGPGKAVSGSVEPGQSKSWTLTGEFPGVFLYHCGADGLNGVWEHIANGMYGGIVVHPTNEEAAKEFYVVFSEIYGDVAPPFEATNATAKFDLVKFLTQQPDLVLTNGMSFKYVPAVGQVAKLELNKEAEIFKVKPGELTRWYIVNPGPNDGVAFHFISGIISGVRDGSNEANNDYGTIDRNDETWWIPPGSASVIESTFPDPGLYVGVDHAMRDVVKGGAFAVLAVDNSTATDHPEGTWVPPAGSDQVSGPPPSGGGSDEGGNGGSDEGGSNEGGSDNNNSTDSNN